MSVLPQPAPIDAKAYFMYGFMGAPFPWGLGFSSGMDTLRTAVLALGVKAPPTYQYPQWRDIVSDIQTLAPSTKVFIFGHSYGANAATWAAAALPGRKIDYLGLYDPTRSPPQCSPLQSNVRYCLCAHGSGMGSDFAGGASASLSPGSACKLATVVEDQGHSAIAADLKLHNRSISTLRAILFNGA